MTKGIIVLGILIIVAVVLLFMKKNNKSSTFESSACLQSGAARVEIQIPADFFPYDSFNGRHYTGAHDALYVRTLMVNNGETGALFISIDTGDISGEWIDQISSIAGIPANNIFLTATHTHESGYISRTLAEHLSEPGKSAAFAKSAWKALSESIKLAKANMQNCTISYGTGKCDANVNRNVLQPDGSYRTGVNLDGISDKTVSVMTFSDLRGKPIGFLYAYAVHSTIMLFSNVKDGGMLFSGDLAGAASRYVESQNDNSAVAVFLLAPCADQGPKLSAITEKFDKKGDRQRIDLGEKGFELVDSLGAEIGTEVIRVGKISKTKDETLAIKSNVKEITVDGINNPIDLRLSVLILGNVVFFGFPGELVTSVGHDIQHVFDSLSYKKSVIVTQCNGSNGYFSNDFGYENKTFDGTASFAKQGYDKLVVSTAKQMLEKIQ